MKISGTPIDERSILVVDDEKAICEFCTLALRNFRVVQAGSCEEAIRLYEQEPFDLVLSDILMPGGSGIDLLKQVKAQDPNAVVVLMTGFVDREVILNALKEDADDFINKPLNLLQLRTTVEKALGRKALKDELAQVKHADEMKNAFLSLVSHKLRTPITGISLFLQNLRTGVFNTDAQAFQENIALAGVEAQYLAKLVEDLLDFSQIMSRGTTVNKTSCDLNEIAADVLLRCCGVYSDADITVDFAPSDIPPVLLDATKMRFALQQVVDNAFKFSGHSGRVALALDSSDDSVTVIVSDSGVGIPESERFKVFDKFYQIDPDRTGQVRGFGLGLFYAKEFIRQHNGTITISGTPGGGTTVTIHLPLQ